MYVSVSAKVNILKENLKKSSYRFIYGVFVADDIQLANVDRFEFHENNNSILVAISVVSVLILLLIVVQLYRKYRHARSQLKYEMSDVRNIAHTEFTDDF